MRYTSLFHHRVGVVLFYEEAREPRVFDICLELFRNECHLLAYVFLFFFYSVRTVLTIFGCRFLSPNLFFLPCVSTSALFV